MLPDDTSWSISNIDHENIWDIQKDLNQNMPIQLDDQEQINEDFKSNEVKKLGRPMKDTSISKNEIDNYVKTHFKKFEKNLKKPEDDDKTQNRMKCANKSTRDRKNRTDVKNIKIVREVWSIPKLLFFKKFTVSQRRTSKENVDENLRLVSLNWKWYEEIFLPYFMNKDLINFDKVKCFFDFIKWTMNSEKYNKIIKLISEEISNNNGKGLICWKLIEVTETLKSQNLLLLPITKSKEVTLKSIRENNNEAIKLVITKLQKVLSGKQFEETNRLISKIANNQNLNNWN